MLKPLQLTAPREAGSPRAPGPCPGRRGQGFAPSSGAGGGGERRRRWGGYGAGSCRRTARRGASSSRKRAVGGGHCARRSERGALSPHNRAARRGLGRGRPFHPARPSSPAGARAPGGAGGAGGRGLRGSPRDARRGRAAAPPRPRPLPGGDPRLLGPDAEQVQPAERLSGCVCPRRGLRLAKMLRSRLGSLVPGFVRVGLGSQAASTFPSGYQGRPQSTSTLRGAADPAQPAQSLPWGAHVVEG